jgi:hypothetical protein
VFPSCWYGSRKVLLNKEVLILSGKKKANRSNVYIKTIFLISGIRFMYKFIIPNIKRRQKEFFRIFEILA